MLHSVSPLNSGKSWAEPHLYHFISISSCKPHQDIIWYNVVKSILKKNTLVSLISDIHHIPISLIKFWWRSTRRSPCLFSGLRTPRYATPAPSCRCVEEPPAEVSGYLRKCVLRTNWYHGSLNVPIEHHPTIRYMVYNGYCKVMSNIPKMGQLPTPGYCGWLRNPAPAADRSDRWLIPLFTGFQYVSIIQGGAGFLPSTVVLR